MKDNLDRLKGIKSVTVFSNRVVERKTPIAPRSFTKYLGILRKKPKPNQNKENTLRTHQPPFRYNYIFPGNY